MKHILVVDDLRTLTVEEETELGVVTYARTLDAAMSLIGGGDPYTGLQHGTVYTDPGSFDEIWLDHDLGDLYDVRPFVRELEACAIQNPYPRTPTIRIITSNPVGRQYIQQALERYYTIL